MGGDSHETENTASGEKWLYPLDQPDLLGSDGSMAAVVSLEIPPPAPGNASAFWY